MEKFKRQNIGGISEVDFLTYNLTNMKGDDKQKKSRQQLPWYQQLVQNKSCLRKYKPVSVNNFNLYSQ